jgi:chromosome segregation ATPase
MTANQTPAPESQPEQTPEARAAAAAETLAAEGVAVTARAVRERSGVRMALAAEAARAWNDQQSTEQAIPDAPPAIQARFTALWREAVTVARAELAEARTGWQEKIAKAEQERNDMADDLGAAEDERDKALKSVATADGATAEQRSRADKAEGRAEALEAERDRLIRERDGLSRQLAELRDQLAAGKTQDKKTQES